MAAPQKGSWEGGFEPKYKPRSLHLCCGYLDVQQRHVGYAWPRDLLPIGSSHPFTATVPEDEKASATQSHFVLGGYLERWHWLLAPYTVPTLFTGNGAAFQYSVF